MGIEYLIITRLSDGLVLMASMDHAGGSGPQAGGSAAAAGAGANGGSSLRARGGGGSAGSNSGRDFREGRELLLQLSSASPPRCTIEGDAFNYHYVIGGPVVVFCATEKAYPKKLAFVYLEEARRLFVDHVARETGADFERAIAATDRPYAFIKFERDLRSLRREFADPSSRQNMQRLQENLQEIHTIMRKNLDDLMQRGDNLNDIRSVSQKLHEESRTLVWGARKLNRLALLRKYGPIAGAVGVVFFFLWLRFYVL